MEVVGARLGRTSARYGPATTFTGPVRKWRKDWVPIASPAANGGTASSTGTGSGSGSRGNHLLLFKWTPANGAKGGDDGDQAAAEPAPRRRRYLPVSVEEQSQESAKSDDENKVNDEDNNTPMDESQVSDEDARELVKNGGTDLNLNLGLKDPDGDTGEQHEAGNNPQAENTLKRKSVTTDLEMRM